MATQRRQSLPMFGFDMTTVQVIAYGATVVLWAAAIVLHVVDWRVVARGLRNGLIVAAILFAAAGVVVALGYGDISAGLTVGAVFAWGFFWMGATLMPIGLLARGTEAWALYGAWVAVPVIVASSGFALAAIRAAQGS
jgi:hypothetical protein